MKNHAQLIGSILSNALNTTNDQECILQTSRALFSETYIYRILHHKDGQLANYKISFKLIALLEQESDIYFSFQLYTDILENVFVDFKSQKLTQRKKLALIVLVQFLEILVQRHRLMK